MTPFRLEVQSNHKHAVESVAGGGVSQSKGIPAPVRREQEAGGSLVSGQRRGFGRAPDLPANAGAWAHYTSPGRSSASYSPLSHFVQEPEGGLGVKPQTRQEEPKRLCSLPAPVGGSE